jgi:hypothetical protein
MFGVPMRVNRRSAVKTMGKQATGVRIDVYAVRKKKERKKGSG